jgi:hypothetical protein
MTGLYEQIKIYLDAQNRSVSWLADQIGMTRAGLNLSLKNNTIKVSSLIVVSSVLKVPISNFFGERKTLNRFTGSSFLENTEVILLSKRYDKFMDQISFLKDYFIFESISNIKKGIRPEHPLSLHLLNKKEKKLISNDARYLLTNEQYSILYDMDEKMVTTPFSKWLVNEQEFINNTSLFEDFYFTLFYDNYLNVNEYLEDGLIKDTGFIKYWTFYKSVYEKTYDLGDEPEK